MRCLAELPVDQREVIVLKIWHRRTFEEIGDLLEISPNTAAGRYRYGLQKLKVRLEGDDYERERDESYWKTNCVPGNRAAHPQELNGGSLPRPSPARHRDYRCAGWRPRRRA